MLDDSMMVVWGEFDRTPQINTNADMATGKI
jgi:hypothetical protein